MQELLFSGLCQPLSDLGRLGMIGLEFQRFDELCPCFLPAFQGSIGQAQEQVGVRVVGVQLNGFLKMGDRLFVFPHVVVRIADVKVGHRVRLASLKLERFLQVFNGLRVTAPGSVNQSEIPMSPGMVGLQFQGSFKVLDTGVVPADYAVDSTEVRMGSGVFGLDSNRFFKEFDRTVVLPCVTAGQGEVHQCAGVPGPQRVGFFKVKDRPGVLPREAVCPAQITVSGGAFRL